jgi:hypothetical protein
VTSFAQDVNLIDVKVKTAPAPALGMWTEASVAIGHDCNQDLLDVAMTVTPIAETTKVQVTVAALLSEDTRRARFCVMRPVTVKSVVIGSGIHSKDDVIVKAMKANIEGLAATTTTGTLTSGIRVTSVAPVATCTSTDCPKPQEGRYVTIAASYGCLETVAPIAFEVISGEVNPTVIVAAGLFQDSRHLNARCTMELREKTLEFFVPDATWNDPSEVNLIVLSKM